MRHTKYHRTHRIGWLRAAVLGAYVGGSGVLKAAGRVTFWGVLAMALTAVVGTFFNVSP